MNGWLCHDIRWRGKKRYKDRGRGHWCLTGAEGAEGWLSVGVDGEIVGEGEVSVKLGVVIRFRLLGRGWTRVER